MCAPRSSTPARAPAGTSAPGLGVVELTVALHHVFDTPRDQLVWDVGHQAYPHKMLTGRRDQFETLRQESGISGFLKRDESEYDVFGAGHAATAISAALGIATARDLKHEDFRVLAVLGDGALTSGLSYEGLNNAGASERDFIVILNDNEMSIAPNVGAISRYLGQVQRNPIYNRLRSKIGSVVDELPGTAVRARPGRAKVGRERQDVLHSGRSLRGARLPLLRPDRRPRHRHARRHLHRGEGDAHAAPRARHHEEGEGLSRRASTTRSGTRFRRDTIRPRASRRRRRRR